MTLYKGRYRVETARLRGWDYTAAGWYFVTVCTRNRACNLGTIIKGQMHLSEPGKIVADEWCKTEQIRPYVKLDEWIIMPNHLHGIIVINDVETTRRVVSTPRLKPHSIGAIIGQFKSICTKRIWAAGFRNFAWQPRFYDHIIRGEKSLRAIRQYIRNNPPKWELDRDNPINQFM